MHRLILTSLLSLAAASSLSAQTLLNENFSDNERATQNLTTTSAWYLRSGSGTATTSTLSASSGALVFTQQATPATANILTYFTGSGSPRTIADGETLTVSFTLAASNLNGSATPFRFGLFNSGASRVSADDLTNFSNAAFNAYTGYSVGFSTDNTATNYVLAERTGTNSAIFSSGITTQLNTNPNNVAINATANTPFSVSLSLARTGTSYLITSIVNGQTASFTDSSISASALDTLALQFGTAAVTGSGTITLDNLSISVSAVPEPSTYAALAGLGVLGLAVARRRRVA